MADAPRFFSPGCTCCDDVPDLGQPCPAVEAAIYEAEAAEEAEEAEEALARQAEFAF